MKTICLLLSLLFSFSAFAQKKPAIPAGKVFGTKPDTTAMVKATKLAAFMAQKPRISITVSGRVTKVIKQRGGWFDVDAGNGKIIAAHFKNYNINIPAALKGSKIIMEGVAEKQFIADDQQHYAGNTVKGKDSIKTNHKPAISFEATGLMVE